MNKDKPLFQIGPDQTRIQAALTKAGRDRLGRDDGDRVIDKDASPVDVRKAGLRHLSGRLATGAVIAVAGLGATGLVVHSIGASERSNAQTAHQDFEVSTQFELNGRADTEPSATVTPTADSAPSAPDASPQAR